MLVEQEDNGRAEFGARSCDQLGTGGGHSRGQHVRASGYEQRICTGVECTGGQGHAHVLVS